MERYIETVRGWTLLYGPRVLAALVIFVVGWFLGGLLRSALKRWLLRARFDPTLAVFLSRLAYSVFMVLVVVLTIQKLGVDTTSLAAAIAAAGLAIGLALQGSLSNFAAGIMLIALRPFRVGDYIAAGGTAGTVEAIGVFSTELLTPDNCRVIVPNSAVTAGTITNYSAMEKRRVDLVVGVGYDADLPRTRAILMDLLLDDARVLKDPEPVVAVSNLGESSVDLVVRPWVLSAEYGALRSDLNERLKMRLDEEGIRIPFPQRDVHLHPVPEREPSVRAGAPAARR